VARPRDPGVGTAVRLGEGIRFSSPGWREDGPGTDQQHAVGRHHRPPLRVQPVRKDSELRRAAHGDRSAAAAEEASPADCPNRDRDAVNRL